MAHTKQIKPPRPPFHMNARQNSVQECASCPLTSPPESRNVPRKKKASRRKQKIRDIDIEEVRGLEHKIVRRSTSEVSKAPCTDSGQILTRDAGTQRARKARKRATPSRHELVNGIGFLLSHSSFVLCSNRSICIERTSAKWTRPSNGN